MTARVLFVGLDAADPDLAGAWMAEGRMPVLAELAARGDDAVLVNPFGMFSSPVWPALATGAPPDRNGATSWRQLRTGTYRLEHRGSCGPVAVPPFWTHLVDAGRTVGVVDWPNVAISPGPASIHVQAWGQHERKSLYATEPPALAAEIDRLHPQDREDHCDDRHRAGELGRLRDEVHDAIARKVDLADWLLDQHGFDVLAVVFGESHCAGHQLWEDREALAGVYSALDAAIGRIVDAAGDPTDVVVCLSHGMAPNITVPHLLDPVLRALDDHRGRAPVSAQAAEFARRAPNRFARLALRVARRDLEVLAHTVDGTRRWFAVANFPAFGAVRLNVAGREPRGRIPAHAREDEMAWLTERFLALRDADERVRQVVRAVHRVAGRYPRVDESGLPDLLVEWNCDRVLDGVWSEDVGEIRRPFFEPRPAGHRQDGRLVWCGPSSPGGGAVRTEDVAPALCAAVGIDHPDDVGSRP